MKITINISNEDYNTLKLITSNGLNGTVESNIKDAIKFFICNWYQYIPYMNNHKAWILESTLKQ